MASSMQSRWRLVQRAQLALTCLSIAANALCAGGIFTFPLLSPTLAEHLKLTQPQLTTIVLAGMIGQYPFSALVGKAIDHYGPWSCSLAASFLFSLGFGSFALEISRTPDDIAAPSRSSFQRLAFFYFLAGLGTVTSYFSSIFAASKNFPNYIGIASGLSMALFGLSPLFLSVLASTFFTSEATGLNVTQYAAFLAVLTGVVNAIGAFNLRTPPFASVEIIDQDESQGRHGISRQDSDEDERTPLVRRPMKSTVQVTVVPVDSSQTALDLFKDPYFWLLGSIMLICLGSCEMVISNIGTIVLSLPSSSAPPSVSPLSASAVTATQVRLLSISNTVSRLLVGPLADFVSPVASFLPCGTIFYSRKHRISRVAFLSAAIALLVLVYGWMELAVRSREEMWVLSIGTGIAYGTIFTALPGIVSGVWGLPNLGRNFGIITYAPFISTPLFSYLYAFVSDAHTNAGDVCKSEQCWLPTFGAATATAAASLFASVLLWRRWRGRV
ncbi:hypothetical protein M0805_006056 [Coniferiporia weirii]|nr:hypothetical protein M0805_006056 [Coniferiporia weirii]